MTLVGSITDRDDIDWYQFDVQLQEINRTGSPFYASFTIDVDYTDGLGRPNTSIYLYDDQGRLIYSSLDSSIPDDQFAPTGSTGLSDLSTGSGGGRDPYLGTVELQEGTYFMAVVPPSFTVDALDDPAIRGEPLNSLIRIAEDRVGFSGGSNIAADPIVPLLFTDDYSIVAADGEEILDGETFTITAADGNSVTYEFDNDGHVRGRNVPVVYDNTPVGSPLFNLFGDITNFVPGDSAMTIASRIINLINAYGPAGVTARGSQTGLGAVELVGAVGVDSRPAVGESDVSLYVSKPANVPFSLGDVTMFVTTDSGLDQSRLITINPYTGGRENTVGIFNANVADVAMRPDGQIYGYTIPEQNPDNGNIGNYHLIDPQSLTTQSLSTNVGDDGIQTFQEDPQNPGTVIDTDDGVLFQGIAFGQVGDRLRGFAVGDRGFVNPLGVIGPTTNLLYEFNVDTGQAFSIMPPDPADRQDVDRLDGGGTQIRERGQLDTTVDPIGLGNTALLTSEVTEVTTNGTTLSRIVDGMQFSVDDGAGNIFDFEFNSGPEVTYQYSPSTGIFVRDGDTFLLDGTAYEFDTGSVILVNALNGNGVVDGQTITITDDQIPSVTRVFEFDDGTGLPIAAGRVAIPFNVGMDQLGLVNTIIGSINSVGNFNIEASLLPNSNRISLRGESPTVGVRTTAPAIGISGLPGGAGILIPVEENSTFSDFGLAIANSVPGAGAEGSRINFSGAVVGSFPQLISRGVFTVNPAADGSVTPNYVGIPFEASDSAAQIAGRIANVITNDTPLLATTNGASVIVQNGAFFASTDDPLRIGGTAPGGNFKGLAIVNGTIYGVTGPDAFGQGGGGLFRILGPLTNTAVADYVETSTDLLTGGRDAFGNPTGGPIEFASLTPGPDNLENGRFAEALFAMDVFGNLYAFDLEGHLLPVFMDSQPSVPTGLPNATGFTFSTLDINLWHVTDERCADDGHGYEVAPDGSRRAEPDAGNLSLHFGFEDPANTPGNWANVNDPGIRNSYDFPGGAQGSITTNTFSLKDYDASDGPALYFNYFLATEDVEGDSAPPPFMRDSLRVFISSDDGEWQLLATNNSFRGNLIGDDEYDYGPFAVQELLDNSGWQQARIDLSPYGGQDNVRLRFDFNSAGSLDLGSPLTGGEELRAVEGSLLFDGDTFSLQSFANFGLETFEFDLGYTLNAVAGSGLADGQTLTLSDGINAPVTIEMDLGDGVAAGNIPVLFHSGQSANEVAMALEDAILLGFGKGVESLDLTREQNDTIPQPARSQLTDGYIVSTGTIGDNPILFGNDAGRDVDMVQVELRAGQRIAVDVDTDPSSLQDLPDSYVRVFNADGDEQASNDDGLAPGEGGFGADSYLEFVAPSDGTYFVGLSGAGNEIYDPFIQGSGLVGLTGEYRMEIHLMGTDSPVTTHLNGARLNLQNVVTINASAGVKIQIDGEPGSVGHPVYVHPNMSDDEVALAVRTAIASAFGSGDPAGIPGYADVIRLYGYQVLDPGPLGLSVTGFPLANPLPGFDPDLDFNGLDGDLFGAFLASTQGDGSTNANFPGFLRGRDNNFEGAYIDDIVIGFAERGTMYTTAPTNDTFTRIPDADIPTEEIIVGDYQIEFRPSSFYGVWDPPGLPTLILTEAYDPTERLSSSVTLIAPPGSDAADGMTFTVSDGTKSVVLEYDDPALRNGVAAGHVPVVVAPLATAAEVANQIRDAINSPTVQAQLNLRAESRPASSRVELFGNAVIDTGVDILSDPITEVNDTLSEATDSLIEPTGPHRYVGTGTLGDNPTIGPGLDVDLIRFELAAGDQVIVDVDSATVPVDSMLRLFDANGQELAISDDDAAPGEAAGRDPYLQYTATQAGVYYAGISGFSNSTYDPNTVGSGVVGNRGDYRVEIAVGGVREAVRVIVNDDRFGDQNIQRDQGQIVIQSNRISNSSSFGVQIDAGARVDPELFAHQGPPRLLFEENVARLAPGVTVKNNVIAYNRAGGIQYSGDDRPAGAPESSVPFGRIVNNTLVGGRPSASLDLLDNLPLGTGILVEENVSPTILNNIISNFNIGIAVDATSRTTVIGGNLYEGNTANSTAGLGDFPVVLGPNDPLFVDRETGNFNLATGSQAIDSSIDSLRDRPAMIFVSQPLGIGVSPILAPEMDVTGQLRVDDPSVDTPAGFGNNVFKDRGAIDRADFLGPTASLTNPQDNDAAGEDRNQAPTIVLINNPVVRSFDILLNDGVTETGRQSGTGVATSSVTRDTVSVTRDGRLLEEGVDYIFSYDATGRLIRLTPLSGIWQPGRVYEIVLDNSETGIRDLADNRLQANQVSGETSFTVAIGGKDQDFGDAPNSFPVLLLDNGASHVIDTGFYLGATVTTEPDGLPSPSADADLDDGIQFLDPLVPGNTVQIQVVASQAGKIDAWMDFNQDGDWNDVGEKILSSHDVVAGANTVNVAIPEVSPEGITFARFRLSRDGGLNATGFAPNGEVEDYRVNIVSELPWSNGNTAMDVNNDGSVAPIDALLVINELNNHEFSDPATGLLPNPPEAPNVPSTVGYVDVDADGYVSPRDALLVINHLNSAVAVQAVTKPVAALPATETSSSLIASALAPVAVADRIEPAAVDQLVEDAKEMKPNLLGSPEEAYSSVFADPRLEDTDFNWTVDDVADDLFGSLRNDNFWHD